MFLGIDVGTNGARALACDDQGEIIAHAEVPFAPRSVPALPPGWFEQWADDWWAATGACLRRVAAVLRQAGHAPTAIQGISVTSTSGTVCLVDVGGEALGSALMYNDGRATAEAEEANRAGAGLADKLGYRFAASFALPKLLWLHRHEPERFRAARYLISPTDFIVGRLTGRFDVSDYGNALKTGYDLIEDCWPDFIEAELGILIARLPKVVAPGTPVGAVTRPAAAETGLAAGTPVLAGMTDGCASQVSTGAVAPGQWNSTLGTTLVIKGVTRALLRDPSGAVYCHRHPDGYWLPGGASNTGCEWVARHFDLARLDALNAAALTCAPTDLIVYPLTWPGERFPFARPEARGFAVPFPAGGQVQGGRQVPPDGDLRQDLPLPKGGDEATRYTAHLEGVGYVERLAYETLAGLGAEVGDAIYVAGGANSSAAWLQIRADILGKTLRVPAAGGGAMGAAIVAASRTAYTGIVPAARAMVRIVHEVEPRPALKAAYAERYARFGAACRERGYLG
jgi:xylulokinase